MNLYRKITRIQHTGRETRKVMNFKKLWISLLALTIFLLANVGFASAGEYVLGSEDVLTITVWGYEELKTEAKIRPDGMISVPLTGEIKAAGLTVAQLNKELNKKMGYFIRNPYVNVVVKEFTGKKVYVLGEVKNPGMYRLNESDSLAEAVAAAGGLSSTAYWTKVAVIRNNAGKEEFVYSDFGKLMKKADFTQNLPLQANDVIFIPKNRNVATEFTGVANILSIIRFFQ